MLPVFFRTRNVTMIIVADRIDCIDFSKLYEVYKDDLEKNRIKNYRAIPEAEGRELARQDYYQYLKNYFSYNMD